MQLFFCSSHISYGIEKKNLKTRATSDQQGTNLYKAKTKKHKKSENVPEKEVWKSWVWAFLGLFTIISSETYCSLFLICHILITDNSPPVIPFVCNCSTYFSRTWWWLPHSNASEPFITHTAINTSLWLTLVNVLIFHHTCVCVILDHVWLLKYSLFNLAIQYTVIPVSYYTNLTILHTHKASKVK